jgi:hypothetical protein
MNRTCCLVIGRFEFVRNSDSTTLHAASSRRAQRDAATACFVPEPILHGEMTDRYKWGGASDITKMQNIERKSVIAKTPAGASDTIPTPNSGKEQFSLRVVGVPRTNARYRLCGNTGCRLKPTTPS